MAKLGYVRISTTDQNMARQYELMNRIRVDRIFEDKASGKSLKRPGLEALLEYARSGDEIYVESFSRLSRSTHELIQTVENLTNNGIHLISQKENLDTTTPSGKLMLTMFAGISQFEREITLERQREGIEAAKKRGVYKGRPKTPESPKLMAAIKCWASGELKPAEAIELSGLKKAAFYKRCKEYGYKRQTGK